MKNVLLKYIWYMKYIKGANKLVKYFLKLIYLLNIIY